MKQKTKDLAIAGILIFAPLGLIILALIVFLTQLLSGLPFPPIQKQSIVDTMSPIQRIEYVRGLIWWLMGFLGISLTILKIAVKPFAYGLLIPLKLIVPYYMQIIEDYYKEEDRREKIEGPEYVRFARHKLKRWTEKPKSLRIDWLFSFWWLIGKNEKWMFEYEQKKITDWESII